MTFVILFLAALAFWRFLWKAIKRGTDTLEEILSTFERSRR